MPSKFWKSEPMNTYNTCILPILGEFPCSQARNIWTCDQPDPKYYFSPKKYDILTKICPAASLSVSQPMLLEYIYSATTKWFVFRYADYSYKKKSSDVFTLIISYKHS